MKSVPKKLSVLSYLRLSLLLILKESVMESLEAVAVAEEKKKELKNLVKLLMYREM